MESAPARAGLPSAHAMAVMRLFYEAGGFESLPCFRYTSGIRSTLEESAFRQLRHCFPAAIASELSENRLDVRVHRKAATPQLMRYLLAREPRSKLVNEMEPNS